MTFSPIIAWPFLVTVAVAAVAFTAWMVLRPGQSTLRRKAAVVRAVVVALLLLAALRPGVPAGEEQLATADVDVFFVVDTSSSMAAEDHHGTDTRLAGVKKDVLAIAKELAGAKFALITFDSKTTVRMPLSQDATALQTAMTTLQPQTPRFAHGTSVTAAGQLLKERLAAAKEQHPGRPALVFYAGDGENTSVEAPQRVPVDASSVAGGAVLGYGSTGGGRMKDPSDPDAGYVQDRSTGDSRDAISRIDEDQLAAIALQLNIPYVHRTGAESTSDMLAKSRPGALTTTAGDGPGRLELYWTLALAAFLLALREPLRHVAALRELGKVA
ncbi:VWA domain-containing protein [Paenarthrobacter sp. NPDC092416]|uniref:vWA domain-containing protein n=1 Tax=Paenarthrobacter sp. NPDC092416 TaxID=3364386 RepID=UPI00382EAB16